MNQVVDSRSIPLSVRADTLRAMASTIVPVELGFGDDAPVVRGTVTDLGPLRITSIRSNARTVERTPRLARDDLMPSLMLGLRRQGTSLVVQDGREVVVRPGDLVVYRSTSPYTLVDTDGYSQDQVRMPVRELALPEGVVRQITAVRLSPGHPVTDLASAYFRRLTYRPGTFTEVGGDAVSRPSLELIRAVVGTHLDATSPADRDSFAATLQFRILEYIRAHLREPTLNAQDIAAEHHISVRHLYNVLAAADISLGSWIRARRLEECRAELSRPGARHDTVSAVAQRWGFRDASNFGRVFRDEYGMSPREWRDAAVRSTTPRPPPDVFASTGPGTGRVERPRVMDGPRGARSHHSPSGR